MFLVTRIITDTIACIIDFVLRIRMMIVIASVVVVFFITNLITGTFLHLATMILLSP